MPARKRGREEMEEPSAPQPNGLLSRLRNTWYFANVFQFIQLFGAVLKVDENFDIEVRQCAPAELGPLPSQSI